MATRTEAHAAPGFDPVVYARLLTRFRALPRSAPGERWLLLEAAHVVGQTRFLPHLETHWLMLGQAWRTRDAREMAGQVLRLLLVPLGHLTGRLPIGNPGRAHISAFRPMAVRADIAETIAQAGPTIP
jgi:hypothetical protein